jgi:hypothetical protein
MRTSRYRFLFFSVAVIAIGAGIGCTKPKSDFVNIEGNYKFASYRENGIDKNYKYHLWVNTNDSMHIIYDRSLTGNPNGRGAFFNNYNYFDRRYNFGGEFSNNLDTIGMVYGYPFADTSLTDTFHFLFKQPSNPNLGGPYPRGINLKFNLKHDSLYLSKTWNGTYFELKYVR